MNPSFLSSALSIGKCSAGKCSVKYSASKHSKSKNLIGQHSVSKVVSILFLLVFSKIAYAGVDLVNNVTDLVGPVAAGGEVTYFIRVNNNGDTLATNVSLVIDVPATTSFSSATGTGVTCDAPVANQVTCDFGSLIADTGVKTVDVVFLTTVQGLITLNTTSTSDGPEEQSANNTNVNESTTINSGANVALTKSGPASAQSGDTITYILTATNNGPDDTGNLRISDPVPSGFNVTNLSSNCSNSGGTVTCDINPVVNGGSDNTSTITGQVTAAGSSTVTNSASIVALTGPADPDTGDNTATLNTSITAGSDLAIAKSRSVSGNLLVGDTFNFVLSPSYTGDSPNSITVTDTIPAEYSIDAGSFATSQNGWSCGLSGQLVTCTKASGGSAGLNQSLGNIVIPVQAITAGNTVTNSTNINAASPSDANPGNNTATDGGVNILPATVDLGISKTGPNPALAVVNVPFNFNFSVSNTGNAVFTGPLNIADNLPAGLTLNSISNLNGWTCLPTSGVGPIAISCDKNPVTINANANHNGPRFNVQATSTGLITNTAVITTSNCNVTDCQDGDSDSASVTASTGPNAADVSLLKTVDIDPVPAGDALTYTLEIVNAGPNAAADVDVIDTFFGLINNTVGATDAGYVSQVVTANVATLGSCATNTSGSTGRRLVCDFTAVPVCTAGVDCPKIAVQIRPGGDGGNRTNTASAISQLTADPNLGNNSGSVTSVVDPRADVNIAVSDTPDPAIAGQTLTYVITAGNDGPSQALSNVVTNTLPLDVTFVSALPSSGSCSTTPAIGSTTTGANRTISCNVGTINNGAQRTITVVVRPNNATRATTITNDVSITTTTVETGLLAVNNTASTTTDINPPDLDLIINLSDDVDPVAIGDAVVYTISVVNSGPSTSENVVVTDTLPTGFLSYQSVTLPAGVSCPTLPPVNDVTGAAVVCNLGNILAGDTVSFDIHMLGAAKGIASNNVTVTSDEVPLGFETNAANNTAAEQTTVRTKADMEVANKEAQNLTGTPISSVFLREDFQFLIQIRNNSGAGLDEADNVEVTDTLPTGMELTGTPTVTVVSGTASTSTCTGIAAATSFTCDLGTVSSGATIDIIAPVQMVVVPGGAVTNTASVTTSSRDINSGNNSNTGTINSGDVLSSTISGRVFRDFNHNGSIDPSDIGLLGVAVTLSGTTFDGLPINLNTATNANGDYSFTDLPASDATGYTVVEGVISDPDLNDGLETAGSLSGNITVNDEISAIVLPDNTVATNYLFAEAPISRVGIAKSASGLTTIGDGTHTVIFTMIVENSGGTPLDNVQVVDDLSVFGTYTSNATPAPGEYTITAAPVISNAINSAGIVAESGFTGSGANQNLLISASSSLPDFDTGSGNLSRAQIDFTLRFFPTTGGTLNNTAVAAATSLTDQDVTDDSFDGTTPDADNDGDPGNDTSPTPVTISGQSISVIKTTGNVVQTGSRAFDIPYTLLVSNPSAIFTASFLQVNDDLSAAFSTAQNITLASPATISNCTGTVLTLATPVYDGVSQTNLLAGTQDLQPGEQCQIDFTANVVFADGSTLPVIQTNTVNATISTLAGGLPIDSDSATSGVVFAGLASVSGRVWRDENHDRIDNGVLNGEAGVTGFRVEVINVRDQIVGSALTDSNGDYTIGNLFPSVLADPDTHYRVRFVDPASGAIFGPPVSTDPVNANGIIADGHISSLVLNIGVNTINQSLPLDPAGVVYDSLTRQPIANAQVSISGPAGFDPVLHLIGGVGNVNQTTGSDGFYQYLLTPTAPAGVYTLSVLEPAGYLPGGSQIIPVCTNTLDVNAIPDPVPVQASALAPVTSIASHDQNNCPANSGGAVSNNNTTQYYLSFTLTPGVSADVVNNHIPLDIVTDSALTVVKSTPKLNVTRSEFVPYTIRVINNFSATLPNIDVLDQIPAGFKYQTGSAKVAGVALEPSVNGRALRWPNLTFAANEQRIFSLLLIVGSGVADGEHINQAWAENNLISQRISNIGEAKVRVIPDATFDCTDVIGKVFDDKNLNGYPDEGEQTLPSVRLATARGWLVTTDDHGRYHITCAAVPNADRGSNFIIKLDERTLPSGYRVTTENPRVVRLTRGKMVKANFGAAIHRVVRLDVAEDAFEFGAEQLQHSYLQNIDELITVLKQAPSVLRLSYLADYENENLAEKRLDVVKERIAEQWEKLGCCYNLIIEEEINWRTGKPRASFEERMEAK